MGLQVRLYLLLGLMLAAIYGVVVGVGNAMGVGSLAVYAGIAAAFVFFQYMIGPRMVGWTMRVKYVTEKEQPKLHRMVAELAEQARIRKPRVGIAHIPIPNAFAFGRSRGDARVCVTEGIMKLLNEEELKAVLGHELSHIRNRDMTLITVLSVLPLICYFIAISIMWGGGGRSREGGGYAALIGLGMLVMYFVMNLMVLYASRIREYQADLGSVRLGNQPFRLASALYKLVYGSARVRKEDYQRVEGVKAFFVNDVSRAGMEIKELRELDTDMSGDIDQDELMALRTKTPRVSRGDKLLEVMSTHPNMLKRIKHLASLGY